MSVLPYHKRYHSDALAGFLPLTLEERGAYQTILDMMYDRGGPVIDNERLLAGYMNCSIRKWRAIREILIEKGKIKVSSDGMIYNPRARKEIENQSKTHRKLVEAGSKGGRNRAENEKKDSEINEGDQAKLELPLEDPSSIRARLPETRNQNKIVSSNEDKSVGTDPPVSKQEILEAWETRMVPLGFPAIRKMTPQRERQLKARLKDSTIEDWQRAMDALERSPFLRGENDRGWKADFDFLLQPKSFTKLIEGSYDH